MSIGLEDDGPLPQTVSSGSFSSAVALTVVRPPKPVLSVDDPLLSFIAFCGPFQKTRLRATAGGVDMARILSLQSTDAGKASIDTSGPHPFVVGHQPGNVQVYARDLSFAAVSVTVSDSEVAVSSLSASIVTRVSWSSVGGPEGPFAATSHHTFSSETSVGWLYVIATFADGTTQPLTDDLTVVVPSPMNQSVAVTSGGSGVPPTVSIRPGAVSLCDAFEVSSCYGSASATIHVTLPAPTSLVLKIGRAHV